MIPSFLTNDLAKKILQTGKAVNFIRRCCGEQDWVLDSSLQVEDWVNDKTNFDVMRNWVDQATIMTNKELIEILFHKYKFFEHCNAIRKYLLLGQGDFIQNLMDLLSEELKKPACQLYKHNLKSILTTAIRSSNAQYEDSEFLNRLDVKLLEANAGDSGWDIFSLDYSIDAPLNTIMTPMVMLGYLKLSTFSGS